MVRSSGRAKLVAFDCDGTLVDSERRIVESMQQAWRQLSLSPPNATAIRRIVGLPLEHAVAKLAETENEGMVAELAEAYRDSFKRQRQAGEFREFLYEGAKETLIALQRENVHLAVVTGKSRRGLVATLQEHGLLNMFVSLQTADDGPGKPSPHLLLAAMRQAGTEAKDTIMVGDTTYDILTARNANVEAIGVSWGYHETEELLTAGADKVVDSFDALLSTLLP